MKTKLFVLAITLLFVGAQANAQFFGLMFGSAEGGSSNLNIGFSPYGYAHYSLSEGDVKYKYDFKSYMNANLSYEKCNENFATMFELTYARAKFDKFETNAEVPLFTAEGADDINSFGFSYLMGFNINSSKAVQLPILLGPRFDYVKGGPFHHLTFGISAKARVKFYVSDKIGLFVGATGYAGQGSKKVTDDYKVKVRPTTLAVDAGFVINLK